MSRINMENAEMIPDFKQRALQKCRLSDDEQIKFQEIKDRIDNNGFFSGNHEFTIFQAFHFRLEIFDLINNNEAIFFNNGSIEYQGKKYDDFRALEVDYIDNNRESFSNKYRPFIEKSIAA